MTTEANQPDNELHQQMKAIQANRTKPYVRKGADSQPVSKVMTRVAAIVQDFVKGDTALAVQSSNRERLFVGYAYVSVCQVRAVEENDGIRLQVRSEPDAGFVRTEWFAATPDEDKLKEWVQATLLDWYKTVV